jgi:nucleoside-diphosphate-sugar epimerase
MSDVVSPRVLVLGANGFIGRRLVEALARDGLFRPVAAVRGHRGRPDWPGIEVVICDATDRAALSRALSGVSYAVNCVAGSEKGMVAATRVLCDTARRSGLRRLVHLSSMAVYGAATGLVGEATKPVPPWNAYAQAKQICEQIVHEYSSDGGEAVILRPGCVYGPGSEPWTGRIARLLQARRLGDLGAGGDGIANLAYIDDVVAAILAALNRPGAAGETFNIASADPTDWNSYLKEFARLLGAVPVQRLSERRLKLETKLGTPTLRLAAIAVKLGRLPIRIPDAISPSLATLFRQNIRLEVQKGTTRLGLGETSLEWGLAASARWIAGRRTKMSAQRQDRLMEAQQQ